MVLFRWETALLCSGRIPVCYGKFPHGSGCSAHTGYTIILLLCPTGHLKIPTRFCLIYQWCNSSSSTEENQNTYFIAGWLGHYFGVERDLGSSPLRWREMLHVLPFPQLQPASKNAAPRVLSCTWLPGFTAKFQLSSVCRTYSKRAPSSIRISYLDVCSVDALQPALI